MRVFSSCADHAPATVARERCGGQIPKQEGTVGSHTAPNPSGKGLGARCPHSRSRVKPSAVCLSVTDRPTTACFWVVWPNNHRAKDIVAIATNLGSLQMGGPQVKVFISHHQPPESCLSPGKLHSFQVAAKRERGRAPNTATIGHDSTFLSD